MTKITLQDGKILMRDGKVGTEQACCCNKCLCELDCDVVQNASITFYGTKNGTVTVSYPSADPNGYFLLFCDIYGNSRQVVLGVQVTEPDGFGGVRNVVAATITIVCGPDALLNDGEYFTNATVTYGDAGDPLQIAFLYNALWTDCDQRGLPRLDTDRMTNEYCTRGGVEQLNPCPVRVVASFS